MAGSRVKGIVAIMASGSLFVSSTAAMAATSMPAQQQVSPWATLTFLTGGAPAAAVCGASVAAAAVQPGTGCVLPVVDTPPPPPAPATAPAEAPPAGFGITPLLAGLAVVVAGIGLFLLVKDHHHGNPVVIPVSPG